MSLAHDQFKQAMEEAVQAELREGRLPDVKALEAQILRRFDRARAGTSQYVARAISERSLSDPRIVNENFAALSRDLDFAFAYLGREQARVAKVLSASQERTAAVLARLEKLARELDVVSLMLPVQSRVVATSGSFGLENPFGTTYLETFTSTARLDSTRTTAQIDTQSNLAMLGFSRHTQAKVRFSALTLNLGNQRKTSAITPLDHLLDDTLDTEWRQLVEGSGRVTLSVTATLAAPRSLTRLKLQSNSPQATQVQLYVTYDGVNEFALETPRWITGETQWTLPATPIQRLRIELTKDFPDAQGSQYFFGLRSLEAFEDTFDTLSEIVTLPFTVPRFAQLAFAFDADVPLGTRVSASVITADALAQGGEWQPVPRFVPQDPNSSQLWQPPSNLPDEVPLVARLVLERETLTASPVVRWFAVMTSQAT